MKLYRLNSTMAGILYFVGTAFGIASIVVGGEVISSIVKTKPLTDIVLFDIVADNPSQLIYGSFFILLMGISLVAMTIFLYPIFRKATSSDLTSLCI